MARGQAQAADKQLGVTNTAAAGAGANAAAVRKDVVPGYEAMLAHPGYSEETKADITGTTMGSAGTAYDALKQSASDRMARTRNTAGYGEQQDELGRQEAETKAGLAQKTRTGFADEAIRQKELALKGLGGVYGLDQDTMARLYGYGPSTLQARAAGGPGWFDTYLQGAAGRAGQVGSTGG